MYIRTVIVSHMSLEIMVGVLASNAVDRWFESRSAQTQSYKIGICCFSGNHAALRRKSRMIGSASWQCVRVRPHVYPPQMFKWTYTMNIHPTKRVWSSTKRTSSSFHWKLICHRHDMAEKLSNTHSLTAIHFKELKNVKSKLNVRCLRFIKIKGRVQLSIF